MRGDWGIDRRRLLLGPVLVPGEGMDASRVEDAAVARDRSDPASQAGMR